MSRYQLVSVRQDSLTRGAKKVKIILDLLPNDFSVQVAPVGEAVDEGGVDLGAFNLQGRCKAVVLDGEVVGGNDDGGYLFITGELCVDGGEPFF